MKRLLLCVLMLGLVVGCAWKETKEETDGFDDGTYYARCNLKAYEGYYISWVNLQVAWQFIPAGTEIEVRKMGKKTEIVDPATGKKYLLVPGGKDPKYLMKFISTEPVDISEYSEEIQSNIRTTIARQGMTKEQVYIAMGPPVWAGENTHIMTYDDILDKDYWVYKRKKYGKKIEIYFDYKTGMVNRTIGLE